MTCAPVFRVADVAEAEALVLVDPRQLRGAEGGRGGDDEPRRTPRRDAVRRRQLGVPAIPLRHQGRDGDEHGHHRHRGRLRRRRSRDGCLPVAPRATSVPTRSPPPSTPSRARPERHRRRSNPARGRRRTPAHHARSGRGTQHTQEPGRLREGREPGFNAHVANVVAAMFLATGQDEAQVVEGANAITTAEVQDGDLYVSVSIASLEVGTVGGGTKLLTQSEGLDISSASAAAATLPAPTPTPSPNASPSVPCGRTLPSPRSPRGTSPAPTPNSVGNRMGVVVRPRFIGSEFVDPTLIMNVLSREIPRDYEIPGIQRISRTYYQRLVQSRTCLREGLLCNLRPNRQRLNRLCLVLRLDSTVRDVPSLPSRTSYGDGRCPVAR